MKSNNSMRLAVVQFYTEANIEKNWERAITYLKEAAVEKVDLIVFPEHFLSSALDGPTDPMDRICALAREYGMDIVAGTYGERDPLDGLVFNTCNYVDKYGQILMSYRKVHLWQVEGKYYKPGSEFYTVTNRFGVKVGLGVCFDLSFHDGFAEMALNQGAELIVIPSMWTLENCGWTGMKYNPKSQILKLDAYCAARAFEYGVVVVYANGAASPLSIHSVDPENDMVLTGVLGTLAGHTQIVAPFKGDLRRCNHFYEEMIVQDINVPQLTRDAESVYRRREIWANKKKASL